MRLVLAVALAVVSPPAAEPEPPLKHGRYAAFWLTKVGDHGEYRTLLVTRLPLAGLPRMMEVQIPPDEAGRRGQPHPQVLEYAALTLTTYKKDSVWNPGVPIRVLTRFKALDERERTVEVDGERHAYEECPLPDLVRLLKGPTGKERIARIHAPLQGMEQTARALRLLVEEQIQADERKE